MAPSTRSKAATVMHVIIVQAFLAKGNVCTGSTCDMEDLSMLQAKVGRHNDLAPYGLRFEFFNGEDTGFAFRAAIDTTVGDATWSLLIDTGSSTLALCNGTTDANGSYVPPVQPVPENHPTGLTTVIMYGAASGCPAGGLHGFVGDSFEGKIGIGKVQADASYAIMTERKGERGNACGLPLKDSVGASRLEGIFGFAGKNGNGPYFSLDTCATTKVDFTTCERPTGCQSSGYLASGFSGTLLPAAKVASKFNIAWSGNFGDNAGALSFGSVQGRQGISAINYWNDDDAMFYGLNIEAFGAKSSGSQLPGSLTPVQSVPGSVIVDTGSPGVEIPSSTCDSIKKHFSESDADVTVEIKVEAAGGQTSVLELPMGKDFWNVATKAGLISCSPLGEDGSWSGLLGLALWFWYDTVHFDIEGRAFEFFPRTDATTPQSMVVEAYESMN